MEKNKICKWYQVCPMKWFYEQGKIDKSWVEDYCWKNNENCKRRQLEEEGIPHPDNMMPDGTVEEKLLPKDEGRLLR